MRPRRPPQRAGDIEHQPLAVQIDAKIVVHLHLYIYSLSLSEGEVVRREGVSKGERCLRHPLTPPSRPAKAGAREKF